MYIKANGEVIYRVNARISERAFKIAKENKIPFSETLEEALLEKGKEVEK